MDDDTLFAGLDNIPWAQLQTAYGSAEEVPIWIRELIWDDFEVRSNAAERLAQGLEHQTTVYTGTAAAIPFLLRLSEHAVPDKHQILDVLDIIAYAAYSYTDEQMSHYSEPRELPTYLTPELRAEVLAFPRTLERIRHELRAGIPEYFRLLSDPDFATRVVAARVLHHFEDQRAQLRRRLRDAIDRASDAKTREENITILGEVLAAAPADASIFTSAVASAESELARFVAADALTHLDKVLVDDRVVAIVLAAVTQPADALKKEYSGLTGGGGVEFEALRALDRIDPVGLAHVIPSLLSLLRALDEQVAHGAPVRDELGLPSRGLMVVTPAAKSLLRIVFGDPGGGKLATSARAMVTQAQRAVLVALASSTVLWEGHHKPTWVFNPWGLPGTRAELAELAGIDLPREVAPDTDTPSDGSAPRP